MDHGPECNCVPCSLAAAQEPCCVCYGTEGLYAEGKMERVVLCRNAHVVCFECAKLMMCPKYDEENTVVETFCFRCPMCREPSVMTPIILGAMAMGSYGEVLNRPDYVA